MSEGARDAIVSMVRTITSSKRDIHEDASLFHDLGIAGDDAAEFIAKLHERFGTRLDGLVFSKFFPNESEALLYHLARLLGYRSRKPKLTIRHLVRVVESGSWFEPS
jgi:hypothetical protein